MNNLLSGYSINKEMIEIKKQKILIFLLVLLIPVLTIPPIIFRNTIGNDWAKIINIILTATVGCYILWFIENRYIQTKNKITFFNTLTNAEDKTLEAIFSEITEHTITYKKIECYVIDFKINHVQRSVYLPIFLSIPKLLPNKKYQIIVANNVLKGWYEL
ncbi:hypothetical protein ACAG96_00250 [Candidatus Izemoplasma sp. B36]|uniref:hypothetical protein n=1 Tax=Candidatus Izemoplasma sp. B36 TaxID=3242468 RepID=UPI0035564186